MRVVFLVELLSGKAFDFEARSAANVDKIGVKCDDFRVVSHRDTSNEEIHCPGRYALVPKLLAKSDGVPPN